MTACRCGSVTPRLADALCVCPPTPPAPVSLTPEAGAHQLAFVAYGKPVTQGSMRSIGRGRMIHDKAATLPWRETVAWSARAAEPAWERLEGPVRVSCTFSFDKPNSAPKRRRVWAITRTTGDLDKLVRAILDALTGHVVKDDSQVIRLDAEKGWVGEPGHLDVPGVQVQVSAVAA